MDVCMGLGYSGSTFDLAQALGLCGFSGRLQEWAFFLSEKNDTQLVMFIWVE